MKRMWLMRSGGSWMGLWKERGWTEGWNLLINKCMKHCIFIAELFSKGASQQQKISHKKKNISKEKASRF